MNGRSWNTLGSARKMLTAAVALVLATEIAYAQRRSASDIADEIEQSQKAARVFSEIMEAPDRAIPRNVLDTRFATFRL